MLLLLNQHFAFLSNVIIFQSKYSFFTVLCLQVLHRGSGYHFHLSLPPCRPVRDISCLTFAFRCLVEVPFALCDAHAQSTLPARPSQLLFPSPQNFYHFFSPKSPGFCFFILVFKPISNIDCLPSGSEGTTERLPGAFSGKNPRTDIEPFPALVLCTFSAC